MKRIGRNGFLNAETHLRDCGMESPLSNNQLDHFEHPFSVRIHVFHVISLLITSYFNFET